MKKIVIRSFVVALMLAFMCTFLVLSLFQSLWWLLLLLVCIFFLDASDSMLVWRLKRITPSMISPLVCTYLIVTLFSFGYFYYVIRCKMEMWGNENVMLQTIYPLLIAIFSFRYFIIVVRVMAKNMDGEPFILATGYNR